MIDYFDASAIVAIVLDERTGAAVGSLTSETDATIVSVLGIGEASSAISRLVRMNEKSLDEGRLLIDALDDWADDAADFADIEDEDFEEAMQLVRAFELKLRMPDALHLALVARLGVRLITLDKNLAAAARAVGVDTYNPAEGHVPGEPKD
ncbi:type II toxin-antitoxin system VapC family toxin [Brevundimonas sp.]|uniref:type II toxin-antitoxin system VapC family toxin n=1 Tax=Brevundimonas sp. TaxID=1871086 RepID=UPI003D09A85E